MSTGDCAAGTESAVVNGQLGWALAPTTPSVCRRGAHRPQSPLLAGPHGLCLCPGWPGGPAAYGAALAGPGTQLCPQPHCAGSLTPRARSGVRASGFSLLPSLHPPLQRHYWVVTAQLLIERRY